MTIVAATGVATTGKQREHGDKLGPSESVFVKNAMRCAIMSAKQEGVENPIRRRMNAAREKAKSEFRAVAEAHVRGAVKAEEHEARARGVSDPRALALIRGKAAQQARVSLWDKLIDGEYLCP